MGMELAEDTSLRAIDGLAVAALPRWGLEGASATLINHSENWTYRVTPAGGGRPVILRVHRSDYHTTDGIRSELDWMRALQAEAAVQDTAGNPGNGRRRHTVGRDESDPVRRTIACCSSSSTAPSRRRTI